MRRTIKAGGLRRPPDPDRDVPRGFMRKRLHEPFDATETPVAGLLTSRRG
jgi:hypothetical protein